MSYYFMKRMSRKTWKYFLFFLLVFFLLASTAVTCLSQDHGEIKHRVFVTGNTADIGAGSTIYTTLESLVSSQEHPFTFIINGDLVSAELTDENVNAEAEKVRRLLEAVSGHKKGEVIIVPGERDWGDSSVNGWESVRKLEKMVKDMDFKRVEWAVSKGCPGPEVIKLDDDILLLAINTQWWNHPHDKPKPVDALCAVITDQDFQEEFEDLLNENTDKSLLIAGHFPIFSMGEYGGHIPFYKNLVPLPVIGGFISSFRRNIGTTDDIINEEFDGIRERIEDAVVYRDNLIYLSGHEQNLQIIRKGTDYFINSGSPGLAKYAARDKDTLFSQKMLGITEIVFYESGKIESVVHQLAEGAGLTEHARFVLYQSACEEEEGEAPVNTAYAPCFQRPEVKDQMVGSYDDTVKVAAGPEYEKGKFGRFWVGDHWRDTWTTEVEVPYLDLDTTFGGLTPYKTGGGRQTRSLRFKAPDGMRYTFRSVNKDPSKRLPYALRETFLAPALRDQTSMQHPYGNLATNIMQNELGFLHPHPNLYVMPDDEKLGPFREEFGNMLGTLEEFPTTPDKGEASFEDAKEIVKSYELFAELYDDHDKRVDAEAYARVRVFDMLVGAWDRHKDNWRWAGYKEEGDTVYQPIPRDRDNVWTLFDGFFPWWLDREWAAPMFEDFEAEIKGLRSLNWQSRHLDRFLTSELTRDDWLEVTRFVQEKMTDEVLESAIRNMPAEIYEVSGGEILEKLKVRVKDLDLYVEEFYEGLAKEADVVGSNKDEYFEVLRQEDGSVEVSMYDEKRGEKGDKLLYNRTFFPNETKQIRLYGLGGDDVFKIKGETGSSIKIKIAGGRGEDTYDDQSDVKAPGKKTLVYEKDKEGDFQLGKEARLASSVNESVYDYDRTAFEYGTYLPLVWATYNSADRFRFGAGLKFTLQKYGKEDFSSDHFVKGIYTTENSKVFNYNVRFHQVIQNWDVELDGYIGFPDLNKYFFGIGNETVKDDDLFDDDFNTYNFNTYQGTLTLVHDFWKFSKFNVGLHYEYNDQPDPAESSINIFQTGTFFGEDDFSIFLAQVSFNLDFRDNEWLPESGWRLFLSHDNGWITSEDWENYGQTFGFVENFITARILLPWTFGFKAGAGHSYGDIPFYNEYSLGEGSYVRGWKKSRFTGENLTFVNSDLRVLLIDIPTKLLPTKFGVKGFFDFGKIIQIGEASDDLHYGYGFGVFLVAWQNAYNLHSSFGFSDEEVWEVNVSIGVAFQ